jgi:hypothetical protein
MHFSIFLATFQLSKLRLDFKYLLNLWRVFSFREFFQLVSLNSRWRLKNFVKNYFFLSSILWRWRHRVLTAHNRIFLSISPLLHSSSPFTTQCARLENTWQCCLSTVSCLGWKTHATTLPTLFRVVFLWVFIECAKSTTRWDFYANNIMLMTLTSFKRCEDWTNSRIMTFPRRRHR